MRHDHARTLFGNDPEAVEELSGGLVAWAEAGGQDDAYFWATHGGAELNLMVIWGGRKYGFEFKYGDAPSMTKSMHTALHDLKLERLFVVYPGKDSYVINNRTETVAITNLRARLAMADVGGIR